MRRTNSGPRELGFLPLGAETPPPPHVDCPDGDDDDPLLPSPPSFLHLARCHGPDWLTVAALLVLLVVGALLPPFKRFVDPPHLAYLKYPHKSDTVPAWSLPLICLVLPAAVMGLVFVIRRDIRDLHHGLLGLLLAVGTTAVITNFVKAAAGRPRPDFAARCFPTHEGVRTEVFLADGDVQCYGPPRLIAAGRQSFPSGHSSYTAAGLGFLSAYVAGWLHVADGEGPVWKAVLSLVPLQGAVAVAVSRTADYRHHWQDVTVGLALGFAVAYLTYRLYYPPVNSSNSGEPYRWATEDLRERLSPTDDMRQGV